MKFVVTGGINSRNLQDYIACDRILAVGGAWMFSNNNALERKAFDEIRQNLQADLNTINKIRGEQV